MIEPINGQMYRPMYNAVNIQIVAPQHNMTPPVKPPVMPPRFKENEGEYACPKCGYYDIPKTSIYNSDSEGDEVSRKTRIADRVIVIPQQTVVEKNTKIADKVTPKKVDYVTNPIDNKNKEQISPKTEDNKTKEEVIEPKKIEIVKPVDVKPVIDINTFIAELTSPDFARQADAMGTISQVASAAPEIGAHLLDVKVIDTLLGIMTRDTSNLAAPTQRQLMVREAIMRGHDVSPQDRKQASVKAPVELAEQNKEYAMFTLASLQKVYGQEVEKMGKVVPLSELPGAKEIIKEVETNPNPHVKVAGLSALNYVQRPEYKADLQQIYQKASTDENPMVRTVAQKALELNA